ncbi:unnamed protein product [Rotaria sordida]|uniref:Ribosome maturation protein SDO1/SBDS central domain-containing protein n=1 Tax=Rotaria sordida TaxID=392033 RepID=A0A815RIL6_9BILA|nr:unnamed protein product [Rotaria sordida]
MRWTSSYPISSLFAPITLNRLSIIGSKSSSVRNLFHHCRKNLPEVNNSYSLHECSLTCISPKELKIGDSESIYTEGGIPSIEASLPKDESKHSLIRIERVLEKVELQVSNEEHAQHLEHTFREIASLVSRKCINPETKHPYTISMTEQAMRDIHFSFNPNRNAKQQVEIVL